MFKCSLSHSVRSWRTAVEPHCFAADENKPVDLGRDQECVGHVAMQRDAKGYLVDRQVHLSPVGPVHVREEEDPAQEEGDQDEDPVDLMQEGILHFHL